MAFGKLGAVDAEALRRFLWHDPILHAIPLGAFSRHGFGGTTSFFGARKTQHPGDLVLVCTVDRGRALIVGDPREHLGPLVELLTRTELRFVFAPPQVVDAVTAAGSPGAERLRHRSYEIEQQMVLAPGHLVGHQPPEGVTVGHATAGDIEGLLEFLRQARTWSGETADSLSRRMERGVVYTGKDPTGRPVAAAWGNPAVPAYPRVSKLFVHPAWRGRGVGTAVTASLCAWLTAQGPAAVLGWVRQRDDAARRVTGKVGFQPGPLWKKVSLTGVQSG